MASLATRGELRRVLQRERRLAGTRLPPDERGAPGVESAAEQVVQLLQSTRHRLPAKTGAMLRGREAWKDPQSAGFDDVVVVALPEHHATQLHDPQAAA